MKLTTQQQRFADAILAGKTATEAYKEAGYKARNRNAASAAACRLSNTPSVAQYIADCRAKATTSTVLTLQEKREFFARVVRTPLRSIDPNDPEHKDGDLIKKYKYTSRTGGGEDGATTEVEEFEKLDPLKAIELDNKLSGDDPDAGAMGALAAALAGLSNKAVPEDKL